MRTSRRPELQTGSPLSLESGIPSLDNREDLAANYLTMKVVSALLRLLFGGLVLGLVVVKYLGLKDAVSGGATTELFGLLVSPATLRVILLGGVIVGAVLIVMGLVELRRKR
jgi:hypothetical protein